MQPSQQLVLQDGSPFGFSPSPIVFVNGISERSPLMRVLKSANVERKPLGFFQGLLQDSTSVIHNEVFVTAHHSPAIARQSSLYMLTKQSTLIPPSAVKFLEVS